MAELPPDVQVEFEILKKIMTDLLNDMNKRNSSQPTRETQRSNVASLPKVQIVDSTGNEDIFINSLNELIEIAKEGYKLNSANTLDNERSRQREERDRLDSVEMIKLTKKLNEGLEKVEDQVKQTNSKNSQEYKDKQKEQKFNKENRSISERMIAAQLKGTSPILSLFTAIGGKLKDSLKVTARESTLGKSLQALGVISGKSRYEAEKKIRSEDGEIKEPEEIDVEDEKKKFKKQFKREHPEFSRESTITTDNTSKPMNTDSYTEEEQEKLDKSSSGTLSSILNEIKSIGVLFGLLTDPKRSKILNVSAIGSIDSNAISSSKKEEGGDGSGILSKLLSLESIALAGVTALGAYTVAEAYNTTEEINRLQKRSMEVESQTKKMMSKNDIDRSKNIGLSEENLYTDKIVDSSGKKLSKEQLLLKSKISDERIQSFRSDIDVLERERNRLTNNPIDRLMSSRSINDLYNTEENSRYEQALLKRNKRKFDEAAGIEVEPEKKGPRAIAMRKKIEERMKLYEQGIPLSEISEIEKEKKTLPKDIIRDKEIIRDTTKTLNTSIDTKDPLIDEIKSLRESLEKIFTSTSREILSAKDQAYNQMASSMSSKGPLANPSTFFSRPPAGLTETQAVIKS